MKQKKCPQCKNLISMTAPTCLFCGRPNKFITKQYVKTKWEVEKNENKPITNIKKFSKYLVILLLIFLVILILIK